MKIDKEVIDQVRKDYSDGLVLLEEFMDGVCTWDETEISKLTDTELEEYISQRKYPCRFITKHKDYFDLCGAVRNNINNIALYTDNSESDELKTKVKNALTGDMRALLSLLSDAYYNK